MRGGLLGVCFGLGLSGCSNKEADTKGSAADTTMAASETMVSGPGGDPTGEDPTGGDPTGEDPTGGDPTGGAGSHRVCDLYLNCLAVIAPTELPSAQQGFGPDGTCWQGSQATADQCLMACTTGLETWHEAQPDEPACGLCQAESDCPDEQECRDGECQEALVVNCGNGIVESGEVCDGGEGCDLDCQGPAPCSPVTQAGCTGGESCLVNFGSGVFCGSGGSLPGIGDPCENNQDCAEGALCFTSFCAAACDQDKEGSCPPGTACQVLQGFLPELDYVGFCF